VSYGPLIAKSDLMQLLAEALERDPEQRLLLYVHGFNNSVNDALTGMARLKQGGRLPGIPMIYSWAAGKSLVRSSPDRWGVYDGYGHDIQIASSSCEAFRSFLVDLTTKVGAEHVILFGHSHGAKLIHSALTDCEFQRRPVPEFNGMFADVIYAAPDIDRDQFLQSYGQLAGVATRVMFYASDKDGALDASGNIARGGLRRLGVGGTGLTMVEGVTAIDASALEGIGDAEFGHAYAFVNKVVLADMAATLEGKTPTCREVLSTAPEAWRLLPTCP
jgi:esterase/lipase superfamily enzyme